MEIRQRSTYLKKQKEEKEVNKMKIKGFLKDLLGSFRTIKWRKKAIKEADGNSIEEDYITDVAKAIHPGKIKANVQEVNKDTSNSVRIKFTSPDIPLFAAGNYLTIELKIGDSLVSRPYSIITSPLVAYREKYVEIIVKEYPDSFVAKYLNHELKVGDEVILEVGLGEFSYNKYRDKKHLVCLAGGVGVTPFISMAHDIVDRDLDVRMTLILGNADISTIHAKDELDAFEDDRIRIIHVIENEKRGIFESGVITIEIIKKYVKIEDSTIFFCGSRNMYKAVRKEVEKLNYDMRKFRKENFAISDLSLVENYDKKMLDKVFNIEVHQGLSVTNIKAKAREPIAVALERSGLNIHTRCRSGECGVCRIKVLSGSYYVPKENEYRRAEDITFNYVHSCSTYPTSDLVIRINIK